jgi:Family of unknown function (DUF6807)
MSTYCLHVSAVRVLSNTPVTRRDLTSLPVRAFLIALMAASAVGSEPPTGFQFKDVNDQSRGLWDGDKPVLVYNHGLIASPGATGARSRSSYIHPVYGLDGEVLTDDFPKDHLYHRGLFWAWPHIKFGDKEYDLWSARADLQDRFQRWTNEETSKSGAELGVENGWFADGKKLVREQVRLHVHPAAAESRAIDIELTWTPIDHPMTLWGAEGKSYGGLNFRVAPRMKTIITVPVGRTNDDLVVTKLPWADVAGDFQGATDLSGAAIFVPPEHRNYPPTWMTRHYGLLSVGWPGTEAQTFPANEPITCRYRLWIHRGNPASAEIQKAYEAYCVQSKSQ